MNSCSESKHVGTKFNVILNAIAGSPHQHVPITVGSRCANFREEGKPLYRKKNTHIAQERLTIDAQLAYERTTSDLVSVVRGMHNSPVA